MKRRTSLKTCCVLAVIGGASCFALSAASQPLTNLYLKHVVLTLYPDCQTVVTHEFSDGWASAECGDSLFQQDANELSRYLVDTDSSDESDELVSAARPRIIELAPALEATSAVPSR